MEKETIPFNKSEFEFQIKSHPDYPSLLSISDTLSFFNIDNGIISVAVSELESLPEHFVAVIREIENTDKLYFIEKKGAIYCATNDKKQIEFSESEFLSRWKGVILLVEKTENELVSKPNKNHWSWISKSITFLLLLLVLLTVETTLASKIFIFFPLIGLLFTLAALKDLFGTKSESINRFCNITATNSCLSVVGSSKWKIFELVNFSDLSMVFFSSQFLGLLVFLLSGNVSAFFVLQQILLLTAIPVLFASIYYQKFVEKKWCPICLMIIAIILIELTYLFVFQNFDFAVSVSSLLLFGLVFISVLLFWNALKKLLTKQKELKEFQLKGTRFMRNYQVFKNTLLTSKSIVNDVLGAKNILLGNAESSLKITLITSPFCGYCNEVHAIIESILEKHPDNVCFDIRFNYNSELNDEKSKKIHQQLVAIYFEQGQKNFMNALHDWFENKDENKLNNRGLAKWDEPKINEILKEQFDWNQKNDLTYTPAIIINQYVFPKEYDRKELIHFINDLSEDEDFQTAI